MSGVYFTKKGKVKRKFGDNSSLRDHDETELAKKLKTNRGKSSCRPSEVQVSVITQIDLKLVHLNEGSIRNNTGVNVTTEG